eukprot:UN09288
MNEHAQSTLQTIQKNMQQQKEISNQLSSQLIPQIPYQVQPEEIQEKKGNIQINNNISNDTDSDDGFDLDGNDDMNDGYIRNKLDPQHSKAIPTMNESESRSHYDNYYKLKKPKLQIIHYSKQYYYGFVSLIPSDFVIRVISIGFIQRIIFGDDINNFHCLLWYTIILYFIIWRFTYSESYGDLCWGYQQYDRLQKSIKNVWIKIVIKVTIIMCYNIMPSGYMYYGKFHRELYPKI